MREQFSVVEVSNQLGSSGVGYPEGRMSVLYKLLNRMGLDGRVSEPSRLGEVEEYGHRTTGPAGDVLGIRRSGIYWFCIWRGTVSSG